MLICSWMVDLLKPHLSLSGWFIKSRSSWIGLLNGWFIKAALMDPEIAEWLIYQSHIDRPGNRVGENPQSGNDF